MLERLKLALMLPLSRKVLVGLAAGALAIANKKLDLGLSEDTIHFLIGTACFVILGIAIEDHGKATAEGSLAAAEENSNTQLVIDQRDRQQEADAEINKRAGAGE